jgi:uncharacterized peroxidase-related enzyme
MPHIELDSPLPGILGLLKFREQTAGPLRVFSHALLRGPSSLTFAEREIIAAHVSRLNGCAFCFKSHAATAGVLLGVGLDLLEDIPLGLHKTPVSGKLRALLQIAGKVSQSGSAVSNEDVAAARAAHATDIEVHDTVLIAAAFCMFNRYVDGLSTFAPTQNEAYLEMGQRLAEHGYEPEPDAAADTRNDGATVN